MLDNKDVMKDIGGNFERVQQAISRMELDLLTTLLERRSELLAVLVEGVLEGAGRNSERASESLREVSRQNAVIAVRVGSRKGKTKSQLDELFQRGQRQKAYEK